MGDEKSERQTMSPWLLLPVLLVVYPLSMGPYIWLRNVGNLPSPLLSALEVIYAPLLILTVLSEGFRNLMEWYVKLWIG